MKQWQRARLDPPIPATLKTEPADFVVDERLSFDPAGSGEHCLLRIEKTNRTTREVAQNLARTYGIETMDVGYAGMKDKRAVTCQWFSLRGVEHADEEAVDGPGIRLLEATRHTHKLRRGEISANRFRITLRDVDDADGLLADALAVLGAAGAPNYFGTQRFGHDNLEVATEWLGRRRRSRLSKFKQGLYLSVLRSFLFNEVLGERVCRSNWSVPVAGDVLADGVPTGPLWGRGRSPASAEAAEIEQAALAPHGGILEGLEHAGLQQARRSMVLTAKNFEWSFDEGLLNLAFSLPAGGYATSFLAEVFDLREPDSLSVDRDAEVPVGVTA